MFYITEIQHLKGFVSYFETFRIRFYYDLYLRIPIFYCNFAAAMK